MSRRVLVVALLLGGTAGAGAQESPAARSAVALAGEGRSDSARALLNRLLVSTRPSDPVHVEALYWRGRLAASGDSAEHDLRRVAIEFSSSPWADDALLQLSHLALVAANPAAAWELAMRLRSDYPGSPLRPHAALGAARAAFETGEPRAACALLDSARTEAETDVEFVNQVLFYRARCRSLRPAAPAPARASAEDTARGAAPPGDSARQPTRASFDVQVLATRSDVAADQAVRRLQQAGLRARIVRGDDGVRRVRLGPFGSIADASAVADAARRALGGDPLVVRNP
jgi:hypothetical protein